MFSSINSSNAVQYHYPNIGDYDEICNNVSRYGRNGTRNALVNPDGDSYLADKWINSDEDDECSPGHGYGSSGYAKYSGDVEDDIFSPKKYHLTIATSGPCIYSNATGAKTHELHPSYDADMRANSPMGLGNILASQRALPVIIHIPPVLPDMEEMLPHHGKKLPKCLGTLSKVIDITLAIVGPASAMTVGLLSAVFKEDKETMLTLSICSAVINFLLAIGPAKSRMIDVWKKC
ncbi:MAG: hypothetical protein LBT64_01870 [Puniceicoccales bacterium]|jgi:hypothetical protein|nr:hypothetical protein [Puniceicoccales bacterium]